MDRARVSKTVSKLGHQLTEVRHRALKTLLSDIRNKTITYEAILSDNSFVAHILNYIQTTECGDSELGTAIDLISELLLSPDVRRQFSCTDIRHILKRKLSQHQDESIQSRIQQIQSQLLYLPSEAPTIDTSVDELENMPPKLMKACLESRNERLEARKEWNQQGQRYLTIQEILNQERNPVPFAARLLQSIEVLAVDDQCLFEIGLKLRFSTDPNELAKAMENLCSLVDDLHPQTFIQKKTIPSAVVSLVSGGVKNSATTQLGCKFLQRFLTKLQSFLWDALDTEMYTHCKEKEKQVLCHDSHLSNSIPQSLILCDSSVGIDVVAFIAEFCAKLIKVVIEGADPLVEFLCITEAALMILIHPFCLDKEQQAHPLLSECLKKMVLYLHKSLNSCGPPENHDLLIDAKTQALASSVIRLLTKTKEVVQMDIEHIVPVLSILSNNFVARYLLPDFVELWIYYDAQVPKASPLKRGFQVEKEIRGVIKALDIIDSILKKDCGDRHWIERFPDIKAGLDWSKEPLCQNIINEVYQLILTNSESLLLEKSADVLRFILIEFSSNSTLEALTTFRNLLMEKVDAKASNWMFQILYSPGVVDVLFNEFVFLPELKSVVVELLELMWGHQTELFLKSIESRMWTLACFQQDPDFVNLLQKLPAERMMVLSVFNLWNKCPEARNLASSSLWNFIHKKSGFTSPFLHFTRDPFEELPKTRHISFTPLNFPIDKTDVEALIEIVLNEERDLDLIQTTIKRIQRVFVNHFDSLEHSSNFEKFILRLLCIPLILAPTETHCGVKGTLCVLETVHWLVKNSHKALEFLQKLSIRDLLPLLFLVFHSDIRVQSHIQEICYAVFWTPNLPPYSSNKVCVLSRIKSHFNLPCLILGHHDDEPESKSQQRSKFEWVIANRKALKEAGSLYELYKNYKASDCHSCLNPSIIKSLEVVFKSLSLLESDSEDECLYLEALTQLRLLIHCLRCTGSVLEPATGIKELVLRQLDSYASFKCQTPSLLWYITFDALLCSNALDKVDLEIVLRIGFRVLLPLLESNDGDSMEPDCFLLDALISAVHFSTSLLSHTQHQCSDILITERTEIAARYPIIEISKWTITQIQNCSQNSNRISPLVSLMLELANYLQNAVIVGEIKDVKEVARDLFSTIRSLISMVFLSTHHSGERSVSVGTKLTFLKSLEILLNLNYGDNDLWIEELGCAWLSKLTRETNTELRQNAFQILVSICRPQSTAILNNVVQFWPEMLSKLVHVSLNNAEADCVRSTALNAILQLLCGNQTTSLRNPLVNSFITSLLQDQGFWNQVRSYALNDNRSPSLNSASLGLLLVATEFDSCVNLAAMCFERYTEVCQCKELEALQWIDSRPTKFTLQRLLHCALSASFASSMVLLGNQDVTTFQSGVFISGLLRLLDHYFAIEKSLEAAKKLLFYQSVHGLIQSASMLDQDWTVFSLRENRLSSSLCKMLSALLAQMKGIKCSHHFQSELLLLISKLLSTKESCSHFITTESEGEDLLTVLVSLWKSNEEQTQENVSMALRNLLAFNWTAKNAFLVMELHKKLIRRLQCKKETHRDDQLVADFSILQHLVVGYTPATDALLDEGILRTLKSYWSLIVANSDMRSKAIKLIKNMFISKPIDVLDQLSEDKRSCSLLVILLKELNPTQVDSQVLDLIAVFACEAKGTHLLLKNGLINKIKELLHFTLGHQQASLSSSIYKVLAAISAHENGRSALLTPRHAKEILKLIFHALSVTDISCRCDCYLFVRNLAFANKFTNYLLSQNGFIEKICEEIHPFYKEDCTSIQFQISTNALSVLWIMASYGEQAKGVIKSLLNWKKKKNVDSVRKNLEADPEMNQEDVQAANTFLCCLNSFAFVMES